jgi:uncharacterized protein
MKYRFFLSSLFVLYNFLGMAQIKRQVAPVKQLSALRQGVAEVETAIPAFIGYTEKAISETGQSLHLTPTKIPSLAEYENKFGKSTSVVNFVLYSSIQLYFLNGGAPCYVTSVGLYNDAFTAEKFINGLDVISTKEEPTLLVFPDAVNLPGNELYTVQKQALRQAATLGDRFCILDIKQANTQALHTAVVNEFRTTIGTDNLKYGAAYTPHIEFNNGSNITLPPSAVVAAQYCVVDKEKGVWKAPANVSLSNISNVVYNINEAAQNDLNIDVVAGKSINVIRKFTGKGILIWGARTLAGNDNEWRYVPVRRFYNMVEESVKKTCLSFVFEPNDANTWIKLKRIIDDYLAAKWRSGALMGAKPSEAYFIKVGLGETMTQSDIQQGRLVVEIGMATIKPAEFIILRVSQKMLVK